MAYPIPTNEAERLSALQSLAILDTPATPEFNAVVALLRDIFATPIAAISFVDRDRQWFKSIDGLRCSETSRDAAFCAYTICSGAPLVIPDATLDNRFADNPLVVGEPFIRSYAGMPLSIEAGHNLGSLCLIDTKPRHFTTGEMARLRRLADVTNCLIREHALAVQAAHQNRLILQQGTDSDERQSCSNAHRAWQR